MGERNAKADNIRFLLILLVVFAHLLELVRFPHWALIYRGIYSFHMPAFVFLTGCYAKFKPRKILFSLIYPYVLFQILYTAFAYFVLGDSETFRLQFRSPYWLLWYLLVTIYYYLLIPILNRKSDVAKGLLLFFCFLLSLLAPFSQSFGYTWAASRFFTFLPFFAAGYYYNQSAEWKAAEAQACAHRLQLLPIAALGIALAVLYVGRDSSVITNQMLYGASSYETAAYTWNQKLLLQIIGCFFIAVLFVYTPNGRIPVLSTIGQNTLPIFLFHGFVVRLLRPDTMIWLSYPKYMGALLVVFAMAVVLVLLLGNSVAAKICKWGFTGHWLEVCMDRRRKSN